MAIKVLKITNNTEINELNTIGNLLDLEVLIIDNLDTTMNELSQINFPIMLKHIIIDLTLKYNDKGYFKLNDFQYDTYEEAVLCLIELSDKFKIPFGCKLTFRFGVVILRQYNKEYYEVEFILSDGVIIYDTYSDNSYRGKYSKAHRELQLFINKVVQEYNEKEIFAVDAFYTDRLVDLINNIK